MRGNAIAVALVVAALILGGLFISLVNAKQAAPPSTHMPGMTAARGQSMGSMTQQMQRQMAQMNATIKALRLQLDKINPDLLTGQDRPMYEYLKILQTHLETMQGMMGTMQGMMMQMPGMMSR